MRWTDSLAKGIRRVLEESGEVRCDYRAEHMDAKRISSPEYMAALRDLYKMKFQPNEFAVIITCDDDAFNFMRHYREELFPGTPVVFCGVNYYEDAEVRASFSNFTGVVEAYDLVSTLDIALKLHPHTRTIYVINDDTVTGVANRRRVDEIAPLFTSRVEVVHLHGLSMRELLGEVTQLPTNSILLLMSFNRDRLGVEYRYRDAGELITSYSPVPVYVVWDFYLGSGVVGGCVVDGETQGEMAARLAVRILRGESADSIPIIAKSPNAYMFDHRQLVRWGIPASALPKGSKVLYGLPQRYEIAHRTILLITVTFAVLVGIVVILAVEILERRRAQKSLEEANRRLQQEIREREEAEKALRQTEEQVRQIQKLDALGRLAGGVAHDFNNLLTAIMGFARLAAEQLPPDSSVRQDIEEVVHAAQRAAGVTRQLLALGRKQMLQVQPTDLNRVVLGIDRLLRHSLGEDIELVTVLGENLPPVSGDPGYLEQVLLNLVVNARDAMPNGGKLYITTSFVHVEPGNLPVPTLKPGPYVLLEVRDTGVGMSKEVLQRAMEPFFTTKPPGEGTGLGLSVVEGIVRQLGGAVQLESEVGKGTTVRVWLPATPGAHAEETKAETESLPKGDETILVVEDEEFVRRYFVRVLKNLGYRVLEAANGVEALNLYKELSEHIDLVLTDMVMPIMGGRELASQLRVIRPDARIIFVTGFSKEVASRADITRGNETIILKPVSAELLATKVREVLDSVSSRARLS